VESDRFPCSMFHVLCYMLHVLKTLPKGRKFNAQYYIIIYYIIILYYYTNDILVAISDWRRQTRGTRPNKLWVHSNNVRPHTAKMSRDYIGLNQLETGTSSPYSPDLASSDFSFLLFGYVKWKLMRYRAETPSEPPVRIRVIMAEIPQETLNAVFSNQLSDWKNPCRQMVSMSDSLKECNILKLILIVRFSCVTLDMGHSLVLRKVFSLSNSPSVWWRIPESLEMDRALRVQRRDTACGVRDELHNLSSLLNELLTQYCAMEMTRWSSAPRKDSVVSSCNEQVSIVGLRSLISSLACLLRGTHPEMSRGALKEIADFPSSAQPFRHRRVTLGHWHPVQHLMVISDPIGTESNCLLPGHIEGKVSFFLWQLLSQFSDAVCVNLPLPFTLIWPIIWWWASHLVRIVIIVIGDSFCLELNIRRCFRSAKTGNMEWTLWLLRFAIVRQSRISHTTQNLDDRCFLTLFKKWIRLECSKSQDYRSKSPEKAK
jgi:hypothetical protein